MAKHEVNILPLGSKYSKGMDFQDVKKKKKSFFVRPEASFGGRYSYVLEV